jgi:hypothetical protein
VPNQFPGAAAAVSCDVSRLSSNVATCCRRSPIETLRRGRALEVQDDLEAFRGVEPELVGARAHQHFDFGA